MKLSLFLLLSLAALAYCRDTVIEKRQTPVVSQIDAEISQIGWEKRDPISKRYWGKRDLISKRYWGGYGGNNYNNNNGGSGWGNNFNNNNGGGWGNNFNNNNGGGWGSNFNNNNGRKRRSANDQIIEKHDVPNQLEDVQKIADEQAFLEKRDLDFDDLNSFWSKRSTFADRYGNQHQAQIPVRREIDIKKRTVDELRAVQEDFLRRELVEREAMQNFEKYASVLEKRLAREYAEERGVFEQQFQKRWTSTLVPSETLKKLATREIQKLDPVIEKRLAERYDQERETFEREFSKKHVDDLAQLDREITKRLPDYI